jgi:hypothetical protein
VEQHVVICFLVGERTYDKDVHEDMLPEDDENCLSRTDVYNWLEKLTQGLSKLGDKDRPATGLKLRQM